MMQWRYPITEAQLIPMGYAIAYRDFDLNVKWAYPIPFHFVVRWLRDFRYWLMRVGRPGYREKFELEAFHKGMDYQRTLNGYHATLLEQERAKNWKEYKRGWDAAFESILKQMDR